MAMHPKGKNGKKDMKAKDTMTNKENGLTAAQKKLPAGLQAAILKKNKK
jgi:hypothetical protein